MHKIIAATRKSPLALAQTHIVSEQLTTMNQNIQVEELALTSQGDKILDQSLAKIGGKGLFVKELEQALIDQRADFAVHSAKDLPFDMSDDFCIAAILQRENPFDAMLSKKYKCLADLPQGAVVGTSSLRRQALILKKYPQLKVKFLRGNVNTRLRRLNEGNYDAIILAVAGLNRLQLDAEICEILQPPDFLPAIGQGALAIQCRADDFKTIDLLSRMNHHPTQLCVQAERAVSRCLEADCHWPLAAFAKIHAEKLFLAALVANPNGSEIIFANATQAIDLPANSLGEKVSQSLIEKGALILLNDCLK